MTRAARVYDKNYSGKKVTYTYTNEQGREDNLSIYFNKGNFMHLCGVVKYEGYNAIQFFDDAVKGRLKKANIKIVSPRHFISKMKAVKDLKKLIVQENVGIVDNNVIYKQYDFGKMVRTKQDLISIGTVADSNNHNVPLTLINIPLATNNMRKAINCFCPVTKVTITSSSKY